MTKERKKVGRVSRRDARLARAAIALSEGHLQAIDNEAKPGGLPEQIRARELNYQEALRAIQAEMGVGRRDMEGLSRLTRKARAVVDRDRALVVNVPSRRSAGGEDD